MAEHNTGRRLAESDSGAGMTAGFGVAALADVSANLRFALVAFE